MLGTDIFVSNADGLEVFGLRRTIYTRNASSSPGAIAVDEELIAEADFDEVRLLTHDGCVNKVQFVSSRTL